jgi:60 kDa SS-A/Ro ribonucleoprotein
LRRRGVAGWYTAGSIDHLALQVVKYRQRGGWSHRDLLRLTYPLTNEPARSDLFDWVCRGTGSETLPALVRAFEAAATAEGTAAMALMTAATEEHTHIVGFTARQNGKSWQDSALTPLAVTPSMRLNDAVRKISNLPFGGKDCALPMFHALERGLTVDAFVVYTDSETWAGTVHPIQALRQYREKTRIAAKLVVVGMVSNGFTIADPSDAGMLDVAGFDAAAPAVIADFIRN